MAFVTKTWKDRLVEYAGRRKLKNVATGEEVLMDVSRSEGTVNQAGDAFSAANMNNLEQRIKTEFDSVNSSLGGMKFGIDGDGNYGYYGADGSLIPFKSGSAGYYLGTGSTFNIKELLPDIDYTSLSNSNFIVGAVSGNSIATARVYRGTEKNTDAIVYGFSVTPTYDATTGILTLSGLSQTFQCRRYGDVYHYSSASQTLTGIAVCIV